MCTEKSSLRGGVDARSPAKSMNFPQAVGLLAVLADGGNLSIRTFGKQELWQHVLATHAPSSLPLLEDATLQLSALTVDRNPPARAMRGRVKKVRFAPDVVEPGGDSRAYRGKNGAEILVGTEGFAVKQAHSGGCHNRRVSLNSEVVRASHNNSTCKAQSLGKPHLPANRMLLYKGKQLWRSTMAFDVRL